MSYLPIIIIIAAAFLLLHLLFKILKAPMKLAFKLLLHALFGFVFLGIFNFVGAWVDLSLGVNWVNAAVAGVLGVPGVVLLLLIKYVF